MMVVGALIQTDRGFLCQLRDDKPEIKFPGLWGFFGGHAEEGENFSAALARELYEELEYRPTKLWPFFAYGDFCIWHAFATEPEIAAMRLHEGREMRAIPLGDVHKYEFIPGCRTLLLTIGHLLRGDL